MASNVTVGANNMVPAVEASKYLGCSYSYLIQLLDKKKIKAQKIEGRWMVDYNDLQKAKSTSLVSSSRGRPATGNAKNGKVKHVPVTRNEAETAELRFAIDKAKLDVLRLAFRGDDTLAKYINTKLDELYDRINIQLDKAFEGI